ncbi:hypothetical protein PVAP13_1NG320438 [Panicum virgatum]|uniref:Uncharacterized protein n=1 Tax=Panicum virgatum TaxID=38727 RepID=A0A8T0X1S8_PANVG|nr:hypothetical protein PVAP13_1NG320438 [Panicum virgatum]
MGLEQQSAAAAREVLAGSGSDDGDGDAWEEGCDGNTAASTRRAKRFSAPSLNSGRSSAGLTFGAPKIDRPRNLPGHPNVTWRHELLRQPLLNIVPMARQEPLSQLWIHADVANW